MGFWVFMVVMDLLIPGVMVILGWVFFHRPPKEINNVYGYRTGYSMKNKDTWEFAHRYCGKLWFRLGWVLLPLSFIPMLLVLGRNKDTVGAVSLGICVVQTLILVISIFPTELALRKNFEKDGRRKRR